LGGVASILNFPLPDIEDEDEEEGGGDDNNAQEVNAD